VARRVFFSLPQREKGFKTCCWLKLASAEPVPNGDATLKGKKKIFWRKTCIFVCVASLTNGGRIAIFYLAVFTEEC